MSIDLTGKEILGFRIGELVGQGGMASVWRAEHKTLGKVVAIKVLDPLLARDESLVQRFLEEARVQCNLQHPGIIAIENISEDPLAMVMEFVQGRSLAEMIGHEVGPIPLQRALPIMDQVLDAVGHAHSHGVVHRDLKPDNILVTPEGQVKVVDFGIAKIFGGANLTRTGTAMGTAAYMSPEQIKGAKDVDQRADIYSLGATFFEMLAGRPPFAGDDETDSDIEVRMAHLQQEPPDPRKFYPGIPGPAVAAVLRALAKDPSARFQDTAEMKEALQQKVAQGDASTGDSQAAATATVVVDGVHGDTEPKTTARPTVVEDPAPAPPASSATVAAPDEGRPLPPEGHRLSPDATRKARFGVKVMALGWIVYAVMMTLLGIYVSGFNIGIADAISPDAVSNGQMMCLSAIPVIVVMMLMVGAGSYSRVAREAGAGRLVVMALGALVLAGALNLASLGVVVKGTLTSTPVQPWISVAGSGEYWPTLDGTFSQELNNLVNSGEVTDGDEVAGSQSPGDPSGAPSGEHAHAHAHGPDHAEYRPMVLSPGLLYLAKLLETMLLLGGGLLVMIATRRVSRHAVPGPKRWLIPVAAAAALVVVYQAIHLLPVAANLHASLGIVMLLSRQLMVIAMTVFMVIWFKGHLKELQD